MRADTAFRASADIARVRVRASLYAFRSARRPAGNRSSGNARSIAMISARNWLRVTSAPVRASSRRRSAVKFGIFAICTSCERAAHKSSRGHVPKFEADHLKEHDDQNKPDEPQCSAGHRWLPPMKLWVLLTV